MLAQNLPQADADDEEDDGQRRQPAAKEQGESHWLAYPLR